MNWISSEKAQKYRGNTRNQRLLQIAREISVPTDAIEYNSSDSEEPSITIRKKEYQWTWYDRVENLGKDQALEDYDEIEKVVLTIPKE